MNTELKRISVVGIGGVGGILSKYLAMYLSYEDADILLQLIDGDDYETRNIERQEFYQLGNKAIGQATHLFDLLEADTQLDIVPVSEFLTPDNIADYIHDGDLIFVSVDHHGVRNLIDQHTQSLGNIIVISGGNDGVDPDNDEHGTYGNVQIHVRRNGENLTPPLSKYHPEIKDAKFEDAKLGEGGCSGIVESVPQLLFTNLAVASAMCNAFYALITDRLTYGEAKFDIVAARCLPQLQTDQIGFQGYVKAESIT